MSGKPSIAEHPGFGDLSDREKEVLQMLIEGKSPKAIAFVIISTERTVDIHKNNILKKLGLDYTVDLTEFSS